MGIVMGSLPEWPDSPIASQAQPNPPKKGGLSSGAFQRGFPAGLSRGAFQGGFPAGLSSGAFQRGGLWIAAKKAR